MVVTEKAAEARTAMVADWRSARADGREAAMFAVRRSDVDGLNRTARALAEDDGALTGPELVVGEGPREGWRFRAGDEVVALRNDRRLGVVNGTRGTVTEVDPEAATLTVATPDQQEVTLPRQYLEDGHVDHAYALTIHKAQGVTVDQAFLLGSNVLYREAAYVGLSRGRDGNDLYVVADPDTEIDPHHAKRVEKDEDRTVRDLADRIAQSRAQTRAADTGRPETPLPANDPERLTRRALEQPPDHLTHRLGQPPEDRLGRVWWTEAARAVETYRDRNDITGPEALGPDEPTPAGNGATPPSSSTRPSASSRLSRPGGKRGAGSGTGAWSDEAPPLQHPRRRHGQRGAGALAGPVPRGHPAPA